MHKKSGKLFLVFVLIMGMILNVPLSGLAQEAQEESPSTIEQILENVTVEERQALRSLQLEETSSRSKTSAEAGDEKGIDYIKIEPDAFTTAMEIGYNGLRWSVDLIFQLKSEMETFDIFLVDIRTDEEIGFLGTMDAGGAEPGREFISRGVMAEGIYHPLTGDPANPIAYDIARTKPGVHKIRLAARDKDGKIYQTDAPVFYGIKQPVLEANVRTGIYEYAEGDTIVSLSGSVYDPNIDVMKAGGMDVSQADNKVVYTMPKESQGIGGGTETVSVPVDENGDYASEFKIDPAFQPFNVEMYAENKSTVRNHYDYRYLYYIQEGTTYGSAVASGDKYRANDEVTVTLSLHNLEELKEANFSFTQVTNPIMSSSSVEFVDVKAHDSIKDNLELDVTEGETFPGVSEINIVASLINEYEESGISGDELPLVDVIFKVNEEASNSIERLSAFNVTYTTTQEQDESVFGIVLPYIIEQDHSELKSNVHAEGLSFMNNAGPKNMDYEAAGARATVYGEEGIEYPIRESIASSGYFYANLPLTDQVFTTKITVPGHFTVNKPFTIGIEENGEIKPQYYYVNYTKSPGGDVNQDHVIDIHDAIALRDHWGSDDRDADINYDGVINEEDMQYIIDNYLMTNPWYEEEAPRPEIEHDGTTLADILIEVGMEDQIPANPVIEVDSPEDDTKTGQEEIVVEGSVTGDHPFVEINGEEVNVLDERFSKKISLEEGLNVITIVATDKFGNETVVKRNVTLSFDQPDLRNILPDADQYVQAGDKVDVRVESDSPDGQASFSIKLPAEGKQSSETDHSMVETEAGIYEGSFTVPEHLRVDGAVIEISLTDAHGNTSLVQAPGKLYVSSGDEKRVDRIYGKSRYNTALEISQAGWGQGETDTVLLSQGLEFADALAGSPLAYLLDAPILLTPKTYLYDGILEELDRLDAEKVIILGGKLAISEEVEEELAEAGLDVQRIAGQSRYDTSALIAEEVVKLSGQEDQAVVANGMLYNDALSVASYAAQAGTPILLTRDHALPEATEQYLAEFGVQETLAVGGTEVISEEVLSELPGAERVRGSNRYATNIALAEYFNLDASHVYLATGQDSADALTGSVLAAKNKSGILLVKDEVPEVVAEFIEESLIHQVTVFGGKLAVSDEVLDQILKLIK